MQSHLRMYREGQGVLVDTHDHHDREKCEEYAVARAEPLGVGDLAFESQLVRLSSFSSRQLCREALGRYCSCEEKYLSTHTHTP